MITAISPKLGGKGLGENFSHDLEMARCAISRSDFEAKFQVLRDRWGAHSEAVGRYVQHLYDDHPRWAMYVQAKVFTLGIQATQRVEGQFGKVKELISRKSSLVELMHVLADLANEAESTHRLRSSLPPRKHTISGIEERFVAVADVLGKYCSRFAVDFLRQEMNALIEYDVEELQAEEASTGNLGTQVEDVYVGEENGRASSVEAVLRAKTAAATPLLRWVDEAMQEAQQPIDIESMELDVARSQPVDLLRAAIDDTEILRVFQVKWRLARNKEHSGQVRT